MFPDFADSATIYVEVSCWRDDEARCERKETPNRFLTSETLVPSNITRT